MSPQAASDLYDRVAVLYGWLAGFGNRACRRAHEALAVEPGQRALNLGAGPGNDHAWLVEAVGPRGLAVAVDLAPRMAQLCHRRTGAPTCVANAVALPFAPNAFDRVYAAYLLDLLPQALIPSVLAEIYRVLHPQGRLVLVSMTQGATGLGRAVIGLWNALYRLAPQVCLGCRPLRLAYWVNRAGLEMVQRQVVEDWGFPSEVVTARRPAV